MQMALVALWALHSWPSVRQQPMADLVRLAHAMQRMRESESILLSLASCVFAFQVRFPLDAATSHCARLLSQLMDMQYVSTPSVCRDAGVAVMIGASSMLRGSPRAAAHAASAIQEHVDAALDRFDQQMEQCFVWLRLQSTPKNDTASFGATFRSLTVELCNIFFLSAPGSENSPLSCPALHQCLHKLPALFSAANDCTWSAEGRGCGKWEDLVSQLAVLAYHALLVQTTYGFRMFNAGAAGCVGMAEACHFLRKHLHLSLQPERYLEGLIVLQLCGGDSTLAMIEPWRQTFNKDKRVWPSCLEAACDFAGSSSVPPVARHLDAVMHFDTVLMMYACAVRVDLSGQRCVSVAQD